MFNVGDRVSVIHDVINGKVIASNGAKITIEDNDGFVRYYRSNELAKQKGENYNLDTLEASEFIQEKTQKKQSKIFKSNSPKTTFSEIYVNANEIDLHIEVLMPEAAHWSVGDILQKQMIACRAFIEKSVANNIRKVVLIHGKGEGVLKSEIYRYLNRVEEQLHTTISYHDADFRTFGVGGNTGEF